MPSTAGIVASGHADAAAPTGYRGQVLSLSPVRYWKLDEDTGTTLTDEVAAATMALSGSGVTLGGSGATSETDTALQLASSSYAETATCVCTTTNITIEAWYKGTSATFQTLYGEANNGTTTTYITLSVNASGQLYVERRNGTSFPITTTQTVSDGQWHHLVAVFADTAVTVYIDGLVAATGTTGTLGTFNRAAIGALSRSSRVNFLTGMVDEVAVYQSALTEAQVKANYLAAGRAIKVTYVNKAQRKYSIGGAANPLLDLPPGVREGDLLVGFYASRDATNFTPPSGWTAIDEADRGTACTLAACWRIYQAGDPTSWAGSVDTNRRCSTGVVALRGVNQTTPVVGSTKNNGATTTPTWLGRTVAAAGSMLVGGAASVATSNTEPATTAERIDFGSGAGAESSGNVWTKNVDAGASGDLTGTIGGGTSWATVLAEVAAAA